MISKLFFLVAILAVLLVSAFQAQLIQSVQAAGSWTDGNSPISPGNLIRVPVSWCAVEGSEVTDSSIGIPNDLSSDPDDLDFTVDDKLWRRHERVTNHIYQEPVGISFRSGINAAYHDSLDFPVIEDTFPPSEGGPGVEGDVTIELENGQAWSQELGDQLNECIRWWYENTEELGVVVGLVAVNIHDFLWLDGSPSAVIGYGGQTNIVFPDGTEIEDDGVAVVIDNFHTFPDTGALDYHTTQGDAFDVLTGHEFGHASGLPHVDDAPRLMHSGMLDLDGDDIYDNTLLTNNEVNTIRSNVLTYPGVEVDPPNQVIQGNFVASLVPDTTDEARFVEEDKDISALKIIFDKEKNVIAFVNKLNGLISDRATEYWTLVNLDSDIATGANHSDLNRAGLSNANFSGADLVIRTEITDVENKVTNGTVWLFENNSAIQLPSDIVTYDTDTLVMGPYFATKEYFPANELVIGVESRAVPIPLYDSLYTIINDSKAGDILNVTLDKPIIVQSYTTISEGRVVEDRLDDSLPEKGKKLVLKQELYPQCYPEGTVATGSNVTIGFSGLLQDSRIHTLVSGIEDTVFQGTTNSTGSGEILVKVPMNVTQGLHLVTIGVDNTALTADCVLDVTTPEYGYEKTPTEPATTEPATTEPATTEPATTEPATTEPATTEPATTEPATTEMPQAMPTKMNNDLSHILEDEENEIEMDVYGDWRESNILGPTNNCSFEVVRLQNSTMGGLKPTSLFICTEDLSSEVTVEDIYVTRRDSLSAPQHTVRFQNGTLGTIPEFHTYSSSRERDPGSYEIRWTNDTFRSVELGTIAEDKLYTLTYNSDPKSFEDNCNVAQKIVESLRITSLDENHPLGELVCSYDFFGRDFQGNQVA